MVYKAFSAWRALSNQCISHHRPLPLHQVCAICQLPTTPDRFVCEYCAQDIQLNTHCCQQCAEPFASGVRGRCGRCLKQGRYFTQAFCPIIYQEPATSLIKLIKHNDRGAIRYAGELFKDLLPILSQHQVFVGVPMSASKLKSHHINPAELLCQQLMLLCQQWQMTGNGHSQQSLYETAYLEQIKDYPSQKNLALAARPANVRGAFAAKSGFEQAFDHKRVLIIDDVMTSGSTLNEAAKTVMALGACSVNVAALARASKH